MRLLKALTVMLVPLLILAFIGGRYGAPSISETWEWPAYIRWIGIGFIVLYIPLLIIVIEMRNRIWNEQFLLIGEEIKLKNGKKERVIGSKGESITIFMERQWNSPIDRLYSIQFELGEKKSRTFFVQIQSPTAIEELKSRFQVVGNVWWQ